MAAPPVDRTALLNSLLVHGGLTGGHSAVEDVQQRMLLLERSLQGLNDAAVNDAIGKLRAFVQGITNTFSTLSHSLDIARNQFQSLDPLSDHPLDFAERKAEAGKFAAETAFLLSDPNPQPTPENLRRLWDVVHAHIRTVDTLAAFSKKVDEQSSGLAAGEDLTTLSRDFPSVMNGLIENKFAHALTRSVAHAIVQRKLKTVNDAKSHWTGLVARYMAHYADLYRKYEERVAEVARFVQQGGTPPQNVGNPQEMREEFNAIAHVCAALGIPKDGQRRRSPSKDRLGRLEYLRDRDREHEREREHERDADRMRRERDSGDRGHEWRSASGGVRRDGGEPFRQGQEFRDDRKRGSLFAADEFKVFVGNLPPSATVGGIRHMAENFGDVMDVTIVRRPGVSGDRCGIVVFNSAQVARAALESPMRWQYPSAPEVKVTVRPYESRRNNTFMESMQR